MVLARTASELSENTNARQNNAVINVLPASDHRFPKDDSTMYAPSFTPLFSQKDKVKIEWNILWHQDNHQW